MFLRLAEQYRAVVHDLELSLEALAGCLRERGHVATCYTCGDGPDSSGASFVASLEGNHQVRFLVSDFGISWVESRDGHELVKLEGADAIQELQRVADALQASTGPGQPTASSKQPTPIAKTTSAAGRCATAA